MFFQQLINGLSIGSIYALMAVGFSLIYSLLNFTNFAHGITVTMGAYAAFFLLTFAVRNLYLAILVAMLIGSGLAMLIEITGYHPLLKVNARRIYLLIAGLGISTMGDNLVIIMFGGRFRAFPATVSTQPVNILGATVGLVDLIILLISILALVLVELFIRKTRSGLAIRSASFDLDITSLMGVNVQNLILTVFLVAGALAGLAGAFLGIKYTAYPTIGSMTIKAFISSVVGGLGSIPGAMLGALILGVGETMISGYISSSMRDIFSFSMMVIILIVRPSGLMGKTSDDKA